MLYPIHRCSGSIKMYLRHVWFASQIVLRFPFFPNVSACGLRATINVLYGPIRWRSSRYLGVQPVQARMVPIFGHWLVQ